MSQQIHGRALVVGVARYSHVSSLPDIVRKDAADVSALLQDPRTCGYAPNKITTLFDQTASYANIRAELKALAKVLSAEESFLLYFSGHGHRTGSHGEERSFLLSCDSELAHLDETALEDNELLELLLALPSQRQVILLDACHAGAVGTLKSSAESPIPLGVAKSAQDKLSSGTGRVLLSSSRADEESLILPGWHNSLFTDSLLRALSGEARDKGDGTIGVFDAFNFVAEDVPKHASQHPVFKADALEENFSIALHSGSNQAKMAINCPVGAEEIVKLLAHLYPLGPNQMEIWSRAGGDLSRLALAGHGVAQWHSAIQWVVRGGGGIQIADLLAAVLEDFPHNADVRALLQSATS